MKRLLPVLGAIFCCLVLTGQVPPFYANINNGGGGGAAGGTGAPGSTGSPGAAGTFPIVIRPTVTSLAQATQRAAMDGFENFQYTLTTAGGNLNLSSATPGITYKIQLIQDGTGSRPLPTISPAPKWRGGSAPTLTTTASAWDILVCYVDTTNALNCDAELGFGP